MTMCQAASIFLTYGSGLNCVSRGPTRLMNIRLDKITVNNWSIQKKNNRNDVPVVFPLYKKRKGTAFPCVPVRLEPWVSRYVCVRRAGKGGYGGYNEILGLGGRRSLLSVHLTSDQAHAV